jgi:hypothetical protein
MLLMERGCIHGRKVFRDKMRDSILEHGARLEGAEQKRGLSEELLNPHLVYFELERCTRSRLPKSDPWKFLIAGLLHYHYPVKVQRVSNQPVMRHFTTVSRAMRFYDYAVGKWTK